jgi:hypothetical protein
VGAHEHFGSGRTRRHDGGIASENVKGIIGDHKEGRSEATGLAVEVVALWPPTLSMPGRQRTAVDRRRAS